MQRSRRRIRPIILLALAAAIMPWGGARAGGSCAGPAAGGDWPIYGRDLSNTRNQQLETTISPANAPTLAPAWTFSASRLGGSGGIDGTPVVADGCAFIGTNTGWVFALNADTGELVWRTKLSTGVFASLAVESGIVYAFQSIVSEPFTVGPRVAALDARTGEVLWETLVSDYLGSDLYASPVVYNGVLIAGVGANSIEGDPDFHGSIVFLDARSGELLTRTWTIPPSVWDQGYSGGGIWSTPAIDEEGYAYFGTGNPFNSEKEYGTTNAIIKVDVERSRPTFGRIVATYKGLPDQYFTTERTSCRASNNVPVGSGFLSARFLMCEMLDLDFGASPNLYRSDDGRLIVGANQKGLYHAVDAETMAPRWQTFVAPPVLFTNAVSSAYADGVIFGSQNPPGWMYAIDGHEGERRWHAPHTGQNDVRHYEPTSVANGVVYQLDGNGILNVYAADDGEILLVRRMSDDVGVTTMGTQSAGIAIARNTIYAATDEFVVAYKVAEA